MYIVEIITYRISRQVKVNGERKGGSMTLERYEW